MTQKKSKALSVYLDDEIALKLNRLREEVRKNSAASGMPDLAPSLGWLARSLLREKLGITPAKNDTPTNV